MLPSHGLPRLDDPAHFASPRLGMARDAFGWVGTLVGERYVVDAVVGEGGFAVVYRGHHRDIGTKVALKALKMPGHFTPAAREILIDRFREEGRVLSKLSEHPNIVRALDFGVAPALGDPIPYLVLEWLDGETLESMMARRQAPATPREALRVMVPIVGALAFAHRLGIVHRDIKPANVFLAGTAAGQVPKVLDFGIAKAMQEGETCTQLATRTSSGFHAFSPPHGAPEQFRPKAFGPTGPWTDVHAVGLLLTELLTGRPVFEGDDHGDFFVASTSPERATPRSRGAVVPDSLERACATATATQPRERFRDAGELHEALLACATEAGAQAPPLGAANHTLPAEPLAGTLPVTVQRLSGPSPDHTADRGMSSTIGRPVGPIPSKRKLRSRTPLLVGAALVAGAVSVAAFIGLSSRSKSSSKKSKSSASAAAAQVDVACESPGSAACREACDGGAGAACAQEGHALAWQKRLSTEEWTRGVKVLDLACGEKVASACADLSKLLRDVRGTPDPKRALVAAQAACDGGAPEGCRRLALQRADGIATKRDRGSALELLSHACDGGSRVACVDRGVLLLEGPRAGRDVVAAAKTFQEQCDAGESSGCVALANLHTLGLGAAQDLEIAVKLLKGSCEQGNPLGCVRLGTQHVRGQGVPKDDVKAVSIYETACDEGAVEGCLALAGMQASGIGGLPRDERAALALAQRGCATGSRSACSTAAHYRKTQGDGEGALRDMLAACEEGDPRGCTSASSSYMRGLGTAKDPPRAIAYLQRACDAGDDGACSGLGYYFIVGPGVTIDQTRGASLVAEACGHGAMMGCVNAGWAYHNGLGVPKDGARALTYYLRGCRGGEALGCSNVAAMHYDGVQGAKDLPRARQLYDEACAMMSTRACANVGRMYERGDGGPKNASRAAELYAIACNDEANFANAAVVGCHSLARLSEQGVGVPQDSGKARQLYAKACRNWVGTEADKSIAEDACRKAK